MNTAQLNSTEILSDLSTDAVFERLAHACNLGQFSLACALALELSSRTDGVDRFCDAKHWAGLKVLKANNPEVDLTGLQRCIDRYNANVK